MKKRARQKSQRKMLSGMILAIILSFAGYSYAVASTTFSASDMKEKNSEIASLQTDIAELELEYLSILNNVSVNDAQDYMLYESSNIGYSNVKKDTRVAYNY